jgi:putative ABC transport system substrate-binding protein
VKRRQFIGLLGAAAVMWPLASHAQQKLPTVGFLGGSSPSTWAPWLTAFVRRLRELGWIEGRTVAIEVRWGEGRNERYAEIAAEFVRLKVDVIVTAGSAIPAVKLATSTIPTVFAVANDPVGSGLVASLSRPGGNVTGLSIQAPELAGKRLELLRELIPGFRGLAIMANAGYSAAMQEMNEMQATARRLGIDVTRLEIRRADDIAPAIETLKGNAGALYVCADSLAVANLVGITASALAARVPTMHYAREYVEAGGLISYGPNYPDLFHRAADYVDKILKGAKPGDLPVEQPTKFELIINMKTAKTLGLEVSPSLLARADEVIE